MWGNARGDRSVRSIWTSSPVPPAACVSPWPCRPHTFAHTHPVMIPCGYGRRRTRRRTLGPHAPFSTVIPNSSRARHAMAAPAPPSENTASTANVPVMAPTLQDAFARFRTSRCGRKKAVPPAVRTPEWKAALRNKFVHQCMKYIGAVRGWAGGGSLHRWSLARLCPRAVCGLPGRVAHVARFLPLRTSYSCVVCSRPLTCWACACAVLSVGSRRFEVAGSVSHTRWAALPPAPVQ